MAFHIKSFRGKIGDGSIEIVSLHTMTGTTGYRIVKLTIIPENPGTTDFEHLIKIYKIPQTTATSSIDFADNTLLAVAYTEGNNSSNYLGQPLIAIFDNETFNQDLYVTHVDSKGALECNYYFELEQFVLNENENTVATLKDIKANATTQ